MVRPAGKSWVVSLTAACTEMRAAPTEA